MIGGSDQSQYPVYQLRLSYPNILCCVKSRPAGVLLVFLPNHIQLGSPFLLRWEQKKYCFFDSAIQILELYFCNFEQVQLIVQKVEIKLIGDSQVKYSQKRHLTSDFGGEFSGGHFVTEQQGEISSQASDTVLGEE